MPEINTSTQYETIIADEADIEKMRFSQIHYNREETLERFRILEEIFDGILTVRLQGVDSFAFQPWDDLLTWMGIHEGICNFVLKPELMHKAVRRYVDIAVMRAKTLESLGILSSNNGNAIVARGGYGYCSELPPPTRSGIGAKLADMWGDSADQILTAVSPEMTREFAIQYEMEWAQLFGLNYYGCCERLDHKLKQLGALPGLRKVSMSPFSDLERGMEQMGGGLAVSFKANSICLTGDTCDRETMKQELIRACGLARKYNCSMEIIMKTMITLNGDPARLWDWCAMAADIAENY